MFVWPRPSRPDGTPSSRSSPSLKPRQSSEACASQWKIGGTEAPAIGGADFLFDATGGRLTVPEDSAAMGAGTDPSANRRMGLSRATRKTEHASAPARDDLAAIHPLGMSRVKRFDRRAETRDTARTARTRTAHLFALVVTVGGNSGVSTEKAPPPPNSTSQADDPCSTPPPDTTRGGSMNEQVRNQITERNAFTSNRYDATYRFTNHTESSCRVHPR